MKDEKSMLWPVIALFAALVTCAMPQVSAHGPEHAKHQIARLGEFKLESGATIPDLRISYVTQGKLNTAKDNAILLLHGFGANHHSFDALIGSGKPFDTDRFFIVASDQFGTPQVGFEHSTSPTSSGMKMKFPQYNFRDMIQAQHKLLTQGLGIRHLVSVTGISMGGAHAVQYAVSHPDFMESIIPIVGGPALGTQRFFWNSQLQRAIEVCAAWQGGNYTENSTECAGTALSTLMHYFFSQEWWETNIPSQEAFEGFRKAWWDAYLGVQDMRDLHYLSRAFGASSLAETPEFKGDISAVLRTVKAKALFIYSPKDMFFPSRQLEDLVKAIAGARGVALDSPAGHLICCGVDPQAYWIMGESIRGFLREKSETKTAER